MAPKNPRIARTKFRPSRSRPNTKVFSRLTSPATQLNHADQRGGQTGEVASEGSTTPKSMTYPTKCSNRSVLLKPGSKLVVLDREAADLSQTLVGGQLASSMSCYRSTMGESNAALAPGAEMRSQLRVSHEVAEEQEVPVVRRQSSMMSITSMQGSTDDRTNFNALCKGVLTALKNDVVGTPLQSAMWSKSPCGLQVK
ncbi:uncharacterized protein LY89DRAFT_675429 [Mollisia scopiformis]|uniref:Uncharacterized protein n=1 Tax=Mollisia scopiformis TaxID=149040 RepID=A0A132BD51_MOLSC|nr:uncharacterized protein LY89DRAFT_675429 [Mollisia scopiformis]KUJ09919.1 hypothetical protein LY89DRAFT_675429 [Mollisia scopiformis]